MSNKFLWMFLKIERFFLRIKLAPLAKSTCFFVRLLLAAQIPAECKIGKNTVFGYGGLGVVIHENSVIGENCRIGTGVTLGSRNPDTAAPIIGNNTFIASGAKILGGVKVGNDVVIGANAVVLNDIPDRSIAVGIPAKVIKSDIDISKYNESFY